MPPQLFPHHREISTAHTPSRSLRNCATKRGRTWCYCAVTAARRTGTGGCSVSNRLHYSFVAAGASWPFVRWSPRCELRSGERVRFNSAIPGMCSTLMARCELSEGSVLRFRSAVVFGYWGYDLRTLSHRLPRRAANDLELPDCHVGFYDSLVVFDHRLGKPGSFPPGSPPTVRAIRSGRGTARLLAGNARNRNQGTVRRSTIRPGCK